MRAHQASQDLAFVRDVVRRTEERVDPHAFHFVHWGAIVLLWYPLNNVFALRGDTRTMLWLGIGALAAGTLLSVGREMLLGRRPRIAGENTFIARQVVGAVYGALTFGVLMSALGPATDFIEGPQVPVMWGIAYAFMAWTIGLVYRREFLVAGVAILVAVVVAMFLPTYTGFVLGPAMGLGLLIPGLMAERRVRGLQEDDGADA